MNVCIYNFVSCYALAINNNKNYVRAPNVLLKDIKFKPNASGQVESVKPKDAPGVKFGYSRSRDGNDEVVRAPITSS